LHVEGSGIWLESLSIDAPCLGPLESTHQFHSFAQDKNETLIRDCPGGGEEEEADGDVEEGEGADNGVSVDETHFDSSLFIIQCDRCKVEGGVVQPVSTSLSCLEDRPRAHRSQER
jgi:hypothetical protein